MNRLVLFLILCLSITIGETTVFCQSTAPISRPSSAPRRSASPPNAPRTSRPAPPPQGGHRPPPGPMGHRPPPYAYAPPSGPHPPLPMHRPPINTSILWVNSYIRNTTNNYNYNYNNNYNTNIYSDDSYSYTEWLPIGAFYVYTERLESSCTGMVQIALNTNGFITGVFYNKIYKSYHPLTGVINRTTGEARFNVMGNQSGFKTNLDKLISDKEITLYSADSNAASLDPDSTPISGYLKRM